jgi:DinB family protein
VTTTEHSRMEHERCAECGFDGAAYDDDALIEALRALGPQWRALLDTAGDDLRTRPAPEVWSALEYAAHSRDVTAMHVVGVEAALPGEEPIVAALPDSIVDEIASGYATEETDAVLAGVDEQASRLAALAADAGPDVWTRGLTIGAERSDIRRLLEHALHDSTHHLRDVEIGLERLRRSGSS